MKTWLSRLKWKGRGTAIALALVGMVLGGCGGDKNAVPAVPASGKVNYNGKPIEKGTIIFHPEKGRSASGNIENGTFKLSTYTDGDGAIPGKYKVGVVVTEDVPTKGGDSTTKYLVPQKFADPDQSMLMAEVPPAGTNDIIINVPEK